MTMVIVQGVFVLKPEDREGFLAASLDSISRSRAEDGCLEYVMAADPVDAGRVVLSERWASPEHLEAHLANITAQRADSGGQAAGRPAPISHEITLFDVAGSRSLG
jgi:quinol monooxygenase YgiN